jgi:hypothetical protein
MSDTRTITREQLAAALGLDVSDEFWDSLPAAPGIDPERLARALRVCYDERWGKMNGKPPAVTVFGAFADEIAAAYDKEERP